jgi:cytochrome c-type biogenesis protein CcsB
MNILTEALSLLALCLYFASTAVFTVNLLYPPKESSPVARWLFHAGFLSLTLLLLVRGLMMGYFPFFTFHETLLFFGWAASLVTFLLERAYRFESVYLFASPLLFLLLFCSFFFPGDAVVLLDELRSGWLFAHIFAVILAYGTFAVSFVISLMYLLADHHLKKKKLSSPLVRLPSLDALDYYSYRLVSAGFFLLTASILLGAMWAQNVWGAYWRWEHKEIWSLITWAIYAAYLHTRLMSGRQGRKVALLNVFGFATVLFNYVVVRFFLTAGLHQFY